MPWDRKLYPKDWEAIAWGIKDASNWQCQECGRECRKPGEDWFNFTNRLVKGNWRDNDRLIHEISKHPVRWVLTVAHLNHQPEDCRPENLRAMCAPCHCRYDLRAMATKRRIKAERNGQLTLFDGGS